VDSEREDESLRASLAVREAELAPTFDILLATSESPGNPDAGPSCMAETDGRPNTLPNLRNFAGHPRPSPALPLCGTLDRDHRLW
jgi:hypothetical protein